MNEAGTAPDVIRSVLMDSLVKIAMKFAHFAKTAISVIVSMENAPTATLAGWVIGVRLNAQMELMEIIVPMNALTASMGHAILLQENVSVTLATMGSTVI